MVELRTPNSLASNWEHAMTRTNITRTDVQSGTFGRHRGASNTAIWSSCVRFGARKEDEYAKKRFQSESYTVIWGTPAAYERVAELEIGDGNGRGGTLGGFRFLPGK
jgi:hypothetical protein